MTEFLPNEEKIPSFLKGNDFSDFDYLFEDDECYSDSNKNRSECKNPNQPYYNQFEFGCEKAIEINNEKINLIKTYRGLYDIENDRDYKKFLPLEHPYNRMGRACKFHSITIFEDAFIRDNNLPTNFQLWRILNLEDGKVLGDILGFQAIRTKEFVFSKF